MMNTMKMYNATVELDLSADALAGELGDQLLERFADHHVVLTRSTLGRGEVITLSPPTTPRARPTRSSSSAATASSPTTP